MASKRFLRKTAEDYIFDVVIFIVMAFLVIACLYPFYYTIILSLNDGLDAQRGGFYFWPRKFTLENYSTFFTDARWLRGFGVSVVRTVLGTIVTTILTAIFAYGLSFRKLKMRKAYMGLVIVCMYFSGGLIPFYMLLLQLKLLNTFWVYIIPQALNLFYVIVGISFFEDIPAELAESAKLDGASEMKILIKIVLPISLPLLATIAIFSAVNHWSAWQDSAFYITDSNLRTIGYLLMEVISKSTSTGGSARQLSAAAAASKVTPMSIQAAAMVIAVLPVMVVYPFLQKYFVTGLTLGSVKG